MALGPNYEKLFLQKRLFWADHARLIESYLGFYKGEKSMEDVCQHYISTKPEAVKEEPVVTQVEEVAQVEEIKEETKPKKKTGRPAKLPPTL